MSSRTLHPDFKHRYAVLGAEQAKSSDDPKKCAEAMMSRLVNEGSLTEENFRIGLTKVFFKASSLVLTIRILMLKLV